MARRWVYPEAELVYGIGTVERLGSLLDEKRLGRALVVSGPNVAANMTIGTWVRGALGPRLAGWSAAVEPQMTETSVRAGVATIRESGADVVIAIGGGSTMDGAKIITAIAGQALELEDYLERYKVRREGDAVTIPEPPLPLIPIIALPTTLSGAEWNGASSVLRPSNERSRVRGRAIGPRIIVYDPAVVATTPHAILTATGMNALDHGIEIYYSRNHDPLKDAFALGSLRSLGENLVPALADPPDLERLGQVLLGSALGTGWMNSLLILERRGHGVTHSLGHVLAQHGMQQGEAHAIVMPHGMRFVRDVVPDRLAHIAQALGIRIDHLTPTAAADAAIDRVIAIRDALGLPARLRDRMTDRVAIPSIAATAMRDFGVLNSPRDVSANDLEGILEAAW
jgi:alcohol dehydrogenase